MKDFFIVLKFELMHFMKNKTFIISTGIICLLLAIGLSIPTIKDTFFSSSEDKESVEEQEELNKTYGFINKSQALSNVEDLKASFAGGKLVEFDSEAKLERDILDGKVEAGYLIKSPTKYQYLVKNNEMMDSNSFPFEEALKRAYRIQGFKDRGINYNEVEDLVHANIKQDTKVLGKDSASNYAYTYILIFGLYFMVIFYGQLIATSVASEKSNRTMEVLITSTDSRNLIFGKVIGGALAGIIQFGLVIAVGSIAYKLNASAWDHALDFIFEIPGSVLLWFSVFGILGYLLYSFIYGALGALVSRTEDISASATPITIIFVAVFFITIMGMNNTESIVLKIASFIPFSSFMSMFVRVSMGSVSNIEVILSLLILVATTVIIGSLAAMIYCLGTLMYGNPVKLKNAIKLLRQK
mgnify:CR=1 FL=1